MRAAISISRIALGFFVLASAASSQTLSDQLRWIAEQGDASVVEFRKQVRPLLSPNERSIEARIEYQIIPTEAVNGQARLEDGDRIIVIGAGMLHVYDMLSTATMFSWVWGQQTCAEDYINDLFEGVLLNGRAATVGARLTPVYDPFVWASQHRGVCLNVSFDRFQGDPSAQRMRQVLLGGSIRWLLAHELGHHIWNHVRRTDWSDAQSRANEQQADEFAFRLMRPPETEPIFAWPAYLLLLHMGVSVEDEESSTHPAGPRRFKILIDALQNAFDSDPKLREAIEESGKEDAWKSAIRKLKAELPDR